MLNKKYFHFFFASLANALLLYTIFISLRKKKHVNMKNDNLLKTEMCDYRGDTSEWGEEKKLNVTCGT
jgi:hypothetical protein